MVRNGDRVDFAVPDTDFGGNLAVTVFDDGSVSLRNKHGELATGKAVVLALASDLKVAWKLLEAKE